MDHSYSAVCNHERLNRIDSNFVRCLACGQSLISQNQIVKNKTRLDFTRENQSFTRNFDRNFSNQIEQVDNEADKAPIYEYYSDPMKMNQIIVNRCPKFSSLPIKFEVNVNGQINYLTKDQIDKMLVDIKAERKN